MGNVERYGLLALFVLCALIVGVGIFGKDGTTVPEFERAKLREGVRPVPPDTRKSTGWQESAGVVVVWFADYGRNADAYRQWAARRFAWLLPTLVSAQRPVDAAVDCNAVRRDLSIERGVVVAAMGDGCIFAVGATDGE